MTSLSTPILHELIRLLLRNVRTSALPYAILALILYALLFKSRNMFGLNIWLCGVLATQAIHFTYTNWQLKKGIATPSIRSIIIVMATLSILQGTAWASVVWVTVAQSDGVGSLMSITIVGSFLSVVMMSLAPVWPLSALFGVTSIVVAAYKFILVGNNYPIISLAGVPFVAALTILSRNSYLTIKNAIELHFQNQSLVEQLQVESSNATQAYNIAQDANHAKSHFLASASHDLRQPLHAISLFLESLSRTHPSQKQAALIDKSLLATQNMADMLHAILDISRIEANAITPNKRTFQLQPLLHKLESSLGPAADAKELIYRTRDTHGAVYSDPVLLEQILRNVIANAIHYTQHGGVLVGCRQRGQQWQIEVWDTGIGIPENKLADIFKEFFQLENPERDRRKGFGLGLSIVKGLADMLEHPYSLHSVSGKGTCFRVSLPASTIVSQEVQEKPVIIQPEKMAMTILIIDDDEAVRDSISTLLSSWGCTCYTADSAESAVLLAQSNRPDLIISDYRLREHKTGVQAIQLVRDILGEPVPALIITGDTSPWHLQELMAKHIPVLHKPLSAQQLYNAIISACVVPLTEKNKNLTVLN